MGHFLHGHFDFANQVQINLDFLLALAGGLVRFVDDDFLDELVDLSRGVVRKICKVFVSRNDHYGHAAIFTALLAISSISTRKT